MKQNDVYGDGTVLITSFEDGEARRQICVVAPGRQEYWKDLVKPGPFTVTAISGQIAVQDLSQSVLTTRVLNPGDTYDVDTDPFQVSLVAQDTPASFMLSHRK